MLCALDMSVHSTHIVYGVECPCRGLHTLVMGLSAVAQIALHWCAVTPHYMGVCVHGIGVTPQKYSIIFFLIILLHLRV